MGNKGGAGGGEVKQLQSQGRKFNHKEKPSKGPETETGRESQKVQEGTEQDDSSCLSEGDGAPRLPRQMSRHCQRELSPVMIK